MRDVRRPDKLEPIVERLTNAKFSATGVPIFPTIMDLLIFSAGVGLTSKRRIVVPSTGKGIPVRIFENNQKEGVLHMVALSIMNDPEYLNSDHDDETIKIFEEYAAGGLEQIGEWLDKNPSDFSGTETLLAKIQELIPDKESDIQNPSAL